MTEIPMYAARKNHMFSEWSWFLKYPYKGVRTNPLNEPPIPMARKLVPIYSPAFSLGASQVIYSCIRGEAVISPKANRKTPARNQAGDKLMARPIQTYPAAMITSPVVTTGIALKRLTMLDMNT